MVSPATATSQATTPWGVTTSPPRMMRSNIMPPGSRKSVQILVHAVFVSVRPGNETAGLQAVGKPVESLPRHFRSTRPKSRIPIVLKRACQNLARNMRVIRHDSVGQFIRAVLGDPGQRPAGGAYHGVECRAVAANAVAAREERRIAGRPARARSVQNL